jgi:hypothetical protein
MNELVCKLALVMPLQHRLGPCRPLLRLQPLVVLDVELDPVHLLPDQEGRVARVENLHLLQHLADDDLDVLVVDLHALEPVDVLDLVDEVVRQRLHA